MSKKLKVLVSILVVVLLITAIPAAIALAQEDESETAPQAGVEALLVRVAEILGVSQDDLVAAFNQARQESREECQATENCSPLCQRIKERVAEKHQRWQELKEKAVNRFRERKSLTDEAGLNIRPAMRGRQMIAVAEGWNEPMPEGPIY